MRSLRLVGRIITVNADDFTAFLADRLAAIVPAGFRVEARDGWLWYSADRCRGPEIARSSPRSVTAPECRGQGQEARNAGQERERAVPFTRVAASLSSGSGSPPGAGPARMMLAWRQ